MKKSKKGITRKPFAFVQSRTHRPSYKRDGHVFSHVLSPFYGEPTKVQLADPYLRWHGVAETEAGEYVPGSRMKAAPVVVENKPKPPKVVESKTPAQIEGENDPFRE